MKRILGRARWLALIACTASAGVRAQEPLTLRQAIEAALKKSPEIEAAKPELLLATLSVTFPDCVVSRMA